MKSLKSMLVAALFAVCFGVGLSACYDDSADIRFFSGEQLIDQVGTCTNFVSHITLYLNGNAGANVGIAYGKGGYQAVTSDVKVVKVGIEADRLILTAGGAKGSAVVTVTDEKGNQAQLTVECGTGVYTYKCIQAGAVPMTESKEVITDLQPVVTEALADYAPMAKGGQWVLIPDKINSETETGTLNVYADETAQPVEGTYTLGVVEEEQPAFFIPQKYNFSYADEEHEFRITPYATGSRMTGIIPIYFMEDVTARFQTASPSTTLPEGAKVYFVAKVTSKGFALQD